jgi:hypothetical protein
MLIFPAFGRFSTLRTFVYEVEITIIHVVLPKKTIRNPLRNDAATKGG